MSLQWMPGGQQWSVDPAITPDHEWVLGGFFANTANNGASIAVLDAALRVYYIPVRVPHRLPIRRVQWWNGNLTTGTVDVGIYTESGVLLISTGATSTGLSSNWQSVAMSTVLPRGRYYIGFVATSATQQFMVRSYASNGTIALRSAGVLQQTVATGVLATSASPATFAAFTGIKIPFFALVTNLGVTL